jgi:hypothetical protein
MRLLFFCAALCCILLVNWQEYDPALSLLEYQYYILFDSGAVA